MWLGVKGSILSTEHATICHIPCNAAVLWKRVAKITDTILVVVLYLNMAMCSLHRNKRAMRLASHIGYNHSAVCNPARARFSTLRPGIADMHVCVGHTSACPEGMETIQIANAKITRKP